MSEARPEILVLCDYYQPGYKAGGPIRTISGVVEYLMHEFLFRLITRDRDLGETAAYPDISPNAWQVRSAIQIMYLPPIRLTPWALRRLLSSTEYDLLYINSCFSVPFGIVPLLLRRCSLIARRPVIVAPRGELAAGALAIHAFKKRLYIAAAKLLNLYSGVVLQASGAHEASDIRRCLGQQTKVMIAPDLVMAQEPAETRRVEKKPGELRLLFLGRISRMKNLDGALTILSGVAGAVSFSIYGPLEDAEYWARCQNLVAQLPDNVHVEYFGAVSPDRVSELMAQHDLLFLPTLGENFGHVILEAMAGGCPVLISDRTRWRDLEATGVGWDVPLEDPERFRRILRSCVSMGATEWRNLSERAREYAVQRLNDPDAREKNRAMFLTALRRQGSPAERVTGQAGG
jgi:glycosyltransferase involved in cell wall biosynthesis